MRRQSAADSARQLAWLADGVVDARAARWPSAKSPRAHGRVAGARFAVLGYGSLGGEELGFGSDLDLVFLYDAPGGEARTPTARGRWKPRAGSRAWRRRSSALLGAVTGAGRLFDVDVRLRPDGAKGLLVSSLASYRRLPARARLDLGTPGAGARALRRRR